ncbi:MAG: T9SS type A sorting domain-containing protein, partial [Chitinophagales bacterium]|nr:T9SS type A sorting domain-containing protein [Chitinophagales bacterium]
RNKSDIEGYQTITGIEQVQQSRFSTMQLFPNPANNQLNITFELKKAEALKLDLFDISGKLIYSSNINGVTGFNHLDFPLSAFSNGIYTLRLNADGFAGVSKLVIAR